VALSPTRSLLRAARGSAPSFRSWRRAMRLSAKAGTPKAIDTPPLFLVRPLHGRFRMCAGTPRTHIRVRHALTRVYARTCTNTHLSTHPGLAHSPPLLPPLALSGSTRSTARSTTCLRSVRTRRGRSSGCAGACGPTCSSPSALRRCHTLRHHCRGHPTTTTALLGQDRGLRRRKGFRLRSSWVSREGESLTLDGCTESARIAQFACVRARARVRVCVCVRLSAWICLCVCVCACV
jgi:hypothetical protein